MFQEQCAVPDQMQNLSCGCAQAGSQGCSLFAMVHAQMLQGAEDRVQAGGRQKRGGGGGGAHAARASIAELDPAVYARSQHALQVWLCVKVNRTRRCIDAV